MPAWSDEDILVLKTAVANSECHNSIAVRLGRSQRSIIGKIHRLKNQKPVNHHVKRSTWWPAHNRVLLDGIAANKPYRKIAEQLGRPYNSVKLQARRLKAGEPESRPRSGVKWTQDERTKLKELIEIGALHRSIALTLGRSLSSVGRRINMLGLAPEASRKWHEDKQLREAGLRRCPRCKQTVSRKDFAVNYCRPCIRDRRTESLEARLSSMLSQAKNRARKKNLAADLTLVELATIWGRQNGLCYYTGVEMLWDDNRKCPSVERKVPSLGYTLDNVVLVCLAVNKMKSDMSICELRDWCSAVIKGTS